MIITILHGKHQCIQLFNQIAFLRAESQHSKREVCLLSRNLTFQRWYSYLRCAPIISAFILAQRFLQLENLQQPHLTNKIFSFGNCRINKPIRTNQFTSYYRTIGKKLQAFTSSLKKCRFSRWYCSKAICWSESRPPSYLLHSWSWFLCFTM